MDSMKKIDPILNNIKNNKGLLKSDSGFMTFLKDMPDDFRNLLTGTLSDEHLICRLLETLPEEMQATIADMFSNFISVPERALTLYNQYRYFEARDLLLKTINIYQNQPQIMHAQFDQAMTFVFQRVQSLTYNLLGDVEKALGNIIDAEDYYWKALNLAQSLGDTDTMAKALNGIGLYLWEKGDLERSREYFHEAFNILSGQPDSWNIRPKILTALSCIYDDIGQHDEAKRFAVDAIHACREKKDDVSLPICLNNLACLNLDWQIPEDALALLEEGLDVSRKNSQRGAEALIMGNAAMTRLMLAVTEKDETKAYDLLEKAEGSFDAALAKSTKFGMTRYSAMIIGNKGYLYQTKGEYREAADAFKKAADIFNHLGAKADEARFLSALAGHLMNCFGDDEGALEAGREAIRLYEGIRGTLKKESHRITYAAQVTDPYETTISCLMKMGRYDEALAYIERAKSRALLELLSARLMQDIFIKTESESFHRAIQLLVEMDEVRRNLEDLASAEGVLPDDEDDDNTRTAGDVSKDLNQSLRHSMEEKQCDFKKLFSDIQICNPGKADLCAISSVTSGQIRECLDHDTFLLELFQTETKLYLVCVSRQEETTVFEIDLGGNEAMELVADVSWAIQDPALRDIDSHDYIRLIKNPLGKMYERIIGPIGEFFAKYRRCLIIPHLFWHYFPFHALYDRKRMSFLCDQIEIGFCPSASILHQCKQKNRTKRDNALFMARHDGDLPMADEEVRVLAKSFADGEACVYTGENSHMDQASGKDQYDVVHLACHGWFDGEHPFLSGVAIPPAKGEDRSTFVIDFLNMQIMCSQITISACESGLSDFTAADELIGLSRALFGTGAASLLLSLWKVADESTLDLMQNYYRHFVSDQQTKTRALQLAMQAVKSKREYTHPYYWAPFVMMGDWR